VYADKRDHGGVRSPRFVLDQNGPCQVGDRRIPAANQTIERVVTNVHGRPLAGAVVSKLSMAMCLRAGVDAYTRTTLTPHRASSSSLPFAGNPLAEARDSRVRSHEAPREVFVSSKTVRTRG